jgi:hypothetical protein
MTATGVGWQRHGLSSAERSDQWNRRPTVPGRTPLPRWSSRSRPSRTSSSRPRWRPPGKTACRHPWRRPLEAGRPSSPSHAPRTSSWSPVVDGHTGVAEARHLGRQIAVLVRESVSGCATLRRLAPCGSLIWRPRPCTRSTSAASRSLVLPGTVDLVGDDRSADPLVVTVSRGIRAYRFASVTVPPCESVTVPFIPRR